MGIDEDLQAISLFFTAKRRLEQSKERKGLQLLLVSSHWSKQSLDMKILCWKVTEFKHNGKGNVISQEPWNSRSEKS